MTETTGFEIDAFVADSVVVADGKLFVQGAGWNFINTTGLPIRQNRIGLGLIIKVPYTATNQDHTFELRLENEDGERLSLGDDPETGPIEIFGGQFQVGRPPGMVPGDEQVVPLAVNFDGLMMERAGRFTFVISLDEQEVKRLPFRVNLLQQQGPMIRKAE